MTRHTVCRALITMVCVVDAGPPSDEWTNVDEQASVLIAQQRARGTVQGPGAGTLGMRTILWWPHFLLRLPLRLLRALLMPATLVSRTSVRTSDAAAWEVIRQAAGLPVDRLFHQPTRLFENHAAKRPLLRLWRDREGWCPFCMMTVLLLEAMEVPYEVRKLPLSKYLRDGETKPAEYLRMVPDGMVPGLQLARELLDPDGDDTDDDDPEANWTPPILNGYHLFNVLRNELPERYPSGDAHTHAIICEGDSSLAYRLQMALYGLANSPSDPSRLAAFGDVVEELDGILGLADDGPYVGGVRPSAADFQLLPWLERAEAYLPHVCGAAVLGTMRWGRAALLLSTARAGGAFAEIAADAESLVADFGDRLGDRLKPTAQIVQVAQTDGAADALAPLASTAEAPSCGIASPCAKSSQVESRTFWVTER